MASNHHLHPPPYRSPPLLLLILLTTLLHLPLTTPLTLTPRQQLRTLLLPPFTKATLLPGIHDALSAKIFAVAETPALFLSGFGVAACHRGAPDAGIVTLSEMEDATMRIAEVLSLIAEERSTTPIPLIVDGDTGYGGAPNIRRTIRGLTAAGAAGISIEDQVFPKRCTYAAGEGVRVVSRTDSANRLKVAITARNEMSTDDEDDRVVIIARTDCRASLGFDEVVTRCLEYEALGADVVYAENLQSKKEYVTLRERLDPKTPMMLAQVQQGVESASTLFTVEEVGDMGYSLALFGVTALQATIETLRRTADEFLEGGGILKGDGDGGVAVSLASFPVVKDVVGFSELDDFLGRCGDDVVNS